MGIVAAGVDGEPIGHAGSSGIDFTRVLKFGREHGAPALRKLRFHERAALLKRLAQHLMAMKEKFYAVSAWTGATRADGWVDIEGGIGTVFSYASIARREFANETFLVEGAAERLSAMGLKLLSLFLPSSKYKRMPVSATPAPAAPSRP